MPKRSKVVGEIRPALVYECEATTVLPDGASPAFMVDCFRRGVKKAQAWAKARSVVIQPWTWKMWLGAGLVHVYCRGMQVKPGEEKRLKFIGHVPPVRRSR